MGLLEPALCPWLPGEVLNPGLGSRSCSLRALGLLWLSSKGSQGSRLNRLDCTLCSRFPWHHALPGDMASSAAMS